MTRAVYPESHPPSERAEATVWHAMHAQLPDGWTVWHHLLAGRGAALREGDFVFAIPGHGIVVVEVKAGMLVRRDGRWYQNGHLLDPQPGEQVLRFRSSLIHRLRALCEHMPEITVALCFPETSSRTVDDAGANVVLFQEDLEWFGVGGHKRLLGAFSGTFRSPTTDAWKVALHRMWGPDWLPTRPFLGRLEAADQAWRQLTDEQATLVRCLDRSHRLAVQGPPGSGKSFLVMTLAQRFQDAGEQTLVLTFTRAIAAEMRAVGLRTVDTVRDLALRCARVWGLAPASSPSTWTSDAWTEMLRAVVAHARQGEGMPAVDVVLIDEAQDFGPDDWAVVGALVGDRARLWIFSDERQRSLVHPEDAEPPPGLRPTATFRLHGAHRTPTRLFRLAERVVAAPEAWIEDADLVGLDEDLSVVPLPRGASDAVREAALDGAIRAVLAQPDVTPDDVAIVSLGSVKRNRLPEPGATVGGVETRRADDPPRAGALVCDTVLRMKGLERPYIVLIDFDLTHPRQRAPAAYIALTRASHHAVALGAPGDVEGALGRMFGG